MPSRGQDYGRAGPLRSRCRVADAETAPRYPHRLAVVQRAERLASQTAGQPGIRNPGSSLDRDEFSQAAATQQLLHPVALIVDVGLRE